MTFWKVGLLLMLTVALSPAVAATFVVNVTQSSYQAEENHNITLEWTFTTKPDTSWRSLFILCYLITDYRFLTLYHVHNGFEVPMSQDRQFARRVWSDKCVLREGRIRLRVYRLRTYDSGLYVCDVKTDYGFGSKISQLNVTAAFQEKVKVNFLSEPAAFGRGQLWTPAQIPRPSTRGRTGLHVELGLMLAVVAAAAAALMLKLVINFTKSPEKTTNFRSDDYLTKTGEKI
ncbi:uncharacterized protein LOC121639799 isoform X2 [Melanotaenia boesemani]|uniref:uncharacterized protein LOC121639799 isoform X2 n=1 Tax=Melanotaenia boesemani TaxID=1250792 RepID=UPI001C056E94|nr:uncharacterized protein LOC121639799 isoform X2 [Melanotaenia boesemani]